jgi:exodeoxyribonuclease VII large subunit
MMTLDGLVTQGVPMANKTDSDQPDFPQPGSNLPEYTVSEISAALKRTVEGKYGRVRVRGEISGFKRATSGHLYFTLKDEDAVLDSVCWKGTATRLSRRRHGGDL